MAMEKTPRGLSRTSLPTDSIEKCAELAVSWSENSKRNDDSFTQLKKKVLQYFAGNIVDFNEVVIDLDFTPPFFRKALEECRKVPYGETRTYAWLANKSGNSKASRAAGQAMARNKTPIIIPCHRVIGSNGHLTGFGSEAVQLDLKSKLLRMENYSS